MSEQRDTAIANAIVTIESADLYLGGAAPDYAAAIAGYKVAAGQFVAIGPAGDSVTLAGRLQSISATTKTAALKAQQIAYSLAALYGAAPVSPYAPASSSRAIAPAPLVLAGAAALLFGIALVVWQVRR